MLYPLTFRPIYKERIWGGRNLERLYRKSFPPGQLIGESWEITDRPEGVSEIANGPLAGKNLRWLMEQHSQELLGSSKPSKGRFPLLVKILDAQEKLSLQVHPPAATAARLGGEPKSEMWYIAGASPEAELFVGLKRGVTRPEFESRIRAGTVAECVHRLAVRPGDAMFLPSGRVHAIGRGNVIFEIQQNSDTTFRVFDWNRLDAKGNPRELHVQESLDSIDFNDFEPALIRTTFSGEKIKARPLVADSLFSISEHEFPPGACVRNTAGKALVIGVLSGHLKIEAERHSVGLGPGEFCLVPACLHEFSLEPNTPVRFVQAVPG
jgi:mannose-6-phosphate isomerase